MEKTKLGISVGFFGAMVFLIALGGGMTPLLLLAGYVFFKEENVWLKKNVVKAIAVLLVYYIAYYALGLIPDVLGVLFDTLGLFGAQVSLSFINNLVYILRDIVALLRTLVLLLSGLSALNMGTIKVAFIDNLIEKHLN
ncbi:MAG: hypothetical protein IJZ82_02170 [Lachnospiraceae bacterium]|nr:hypothetical protein [Lachnospiraceae bacterium]